MSNCICGGSGSDIASLYVTDHKESLILAAEEYWMNMETLVEEQFAKKDYKNGEYVCTIVFHS